VASIRHDESLLTGLSYGLVVIFSSALHREVARSSAQGMRAGSLAANGIARRDVPSPADC